MLDAPPTDEVVGCSARIRSAPGGGLLAHGYRSAPRGDYADAGDGAAGHAGRHARRQIRAVRGRVYLTGIQALVRLPLLQNRRDRAAELNTAAFISGYRGSPLGGYDLALWGAKKHLDNAQHNFEPGINEDLAATAVWGSQQVGLLPNPKYDGVFGLWYGKGPGVDRSGDVLKHASYQGTARIWRRDRAVRRRSWRTLLHTCPPERHRADPFRHAGASTRARSRSCSPSASPRWAASRYTGCWIGMKALTDTVEGGASIPADMDRLQFAVPTDFAMPPNGLNLHAAPGLGAGYRGAALRAAPRRGCRPGCAPTSSTVWPGAARAVIASASSPPARPISMWSRHCAGWGWTSTAPPLSASASTRSAWSGRWSRSGCGIRRNLRRNPRGRGKASDHRGSDHHHSLQHAGPCRPRLTGKLDENGAPLLREVGELDPDLMLHVLAGPAARPDRG